MRRTSRHHFRHFEFHVETFLPQVLDMLSERGLDLVLVDVDRAGTPAGHDLVYMDDDEPSTVSLREVLGEWERALGVT
jgi:hypothetical protein